MSLQSNFGSGEGRLSRQGADDGQDPSSETHKSIPKSTIFSEPLHLIRRHHVVLLLLGKTGEETKSREKLDRPEASGIAIISICIFCLLIIMQTSINYKSIIVKKLRVFELVNFAVLIIHFRTYSLVYVILVILSNRASSVCTTMPHIKDV
jgi:hypothetical protein